MSTPIDIYYGVWWLPDHEKKIYGVLKVEDGLNATFETTDTLHSEDFDFWISEMTNHEVLLGVATSTMDGNDYSFKLYTIVEFNRSEQAFTKTKYKVTRILRAKPNPEDSSTAFSSLRMTSAFLKDWIKITGLKRELIKNDDSKFGHKIEYIQPESITLFKSENNRYYVYFRALRSFNKESDFVLKEAPYLNFEFEDYKSFKEVIQFKISIERFLMILCERSQRFDQFDVRSADNTDFENILPHDKVGPLWPAKYDFEEFKSKSQVLFESWFKIESEFKLILDTFFFAFVDYKMAIENRFLNYLFALELFHRKKVKGTLPLSAKNKKMYEKTLDEVKSGDVRSWLEKVLNHEREINLAQRIPELLDLIADKTGISLDDNTIKRCIQTRHYLVHLDAQYAEQRFSGEEFIQVNDSLKTLMLRLLKNQLLGKVNTQEDNNQAVQKDLLGGSDKRSLTT